jgi:hypothetical protein
MVITVSIWIGQPSLKVQGTTCHTLVSLICVQNSVTICSRRLLGACTKCHTSIPFYCYICQPPLPCPLFLADVYRSNVWTKLYLQSAQSSKSDSSWLKRGVSTQKKCLLGMRMTEKYNQGSTTLKTTAFLVSVGKSQQKLRRSVTLKRMIPPPITHGKWIPFFLNLEEYSALLCLMAENFVLANRCPMLLISVY